jgi:glycerol uptake facilitator-like aquaporin
LITKKISVIRAIAYWIAQFSGAIIGALMLRSILPPELHYHLGCHGLHSALTPAQGWFAETVFTSFFIFVVFATAVSPFAGKLAPMQGGDYGPGKLAPLAVGLTITVLHLVGIPITGASMNPARSFGPAVVLGGDCWDSHWIYWVRPLMGSTISAFVSSAIFLSNPDQILAALAQRSLNNANSNAAARADGAIPVPMDDKP